MAKQLNILFVCSEATPLAKTGGMADVCDAIPTYLAKSGHQVDVMLPAYQAIDTTGVEVETLLKKIDIPLGEQTVTGSVLAAKIDRPWRALLVKQDELFDRPGLYVDPDSGRDYPDNAQRFAFFAKAAMETIKQAKLKYDVVHAHDWQGALVVSYLRKRAEQSPLWAKPATLFTIHNLGYQGLFPAEAGVYFDLPEAFASGETEFGGQWGLLKGGLVHADFISTVSEKYAKEIQTPELGFGLHEVLTARADRLVGITHGVDDTIWNPAIDPYIAEKYDAKNFQGKQTCKADLLKQFGLPLEWGHKPVLGFIGRLIEQKGLDLILAVADDMVAHGFMLVFLGTGEKKYEQALLELARRFPEAVAARIDFSEKLAHQIEAGADLLLLPSIYEPCGLSQMYSHKYGTLPVVRATGGLDDTVKGWSKNARHPNGFKFNDANPEALLKTLADAAIIYEDKKRWQKMIDNAMAVDHSWDKAVSKYVRLYNKIIREKKAAAKKAKQAPAS